MKYLSPSFQTPANSKAYVDNWDKVFGKKKVKKVKKEEETTPETRAVSLPSRIKKNSARCLQCGDIIESKHRHDFVWCKCKSIAVDGGKDYLRRCGDLDAYEDLSEYEEV